MAWRFVEQPNGLLARFSEAVDSFTDYDMTDPEAIECGIFDYGASGKVVLDKIKSARKNKGRFAEAIEIMRTVHGDEHAEEFLMGGEAESNG